jgi:outer membrane protein insertion porin family
MNFKLLYSLVIGLIVTSFAYASPSDTVVRKIEISGLSTLKEIDIPQIALIKSKAGRGLSENDIGLASQQLYLTGYFKSVKADESVTNNEKVITFRVEENPVIQSISVSGNTIYSTQQLLEVISHKPGSVLNLGRLTKDKVALEQYYLSQNYDLFRINTITMATGNRLVFEVLEGRISSVNILGLTDIKPYVLLREMTQTPGSVFNSKNLREDREKWVRLGYFSNVTAPQLRETSSKNNEIGLTFSVTERKTNVLDVGLEQEYSTVVAFLLGTVNHALIHSDMFTGKAQFGNDNSGEYKITSYTLKYFQPWFLNQHKFSFTSTVWDEVRTEFLGKDVTAQTLLNNKRQGQQIVFGFPIVDNLLVVSTRLKSENVSPPAGETRFSAYSIRSAGFQLSYRTVTSLSNPKSGMYWTMDYERGGDLGLLDLGGLKFDRLSLNAAQFFALSPQDTLAIHSVIGTFYSPQTNVNSFDTEAYTLGGANSLRGYKETSPFIGTRKILFNLELRHDFSENFQGLLFFDVGRTFNSGENFFSRANAHSGQGFGLRLSTPIAPIRLDFAWGELGLILHFGLGQVF